MSIEFILKQLRAMPAAKATGLDGISCKVLKLRAEIIAPHIVNICNTSIETAQFPRSWKKAGVVPLYKSGDSNDVANYRPISLLPVLLKLLERYAYNHFCIPRRFSITARRTIRLRIFFPINAPVMGRFQLVNFGVWGYVLELIFWVVIAIIVSPTLTITLITTLTIS